MVLAIEDEARAPLVAALEWAYDFLARLDSQAMNPGPDHLVAVTSEVWMDAIHPRLAVLRAALSREDRP